MFEGKKSFKNPAALLGLLYMSQKNLYGFFLLHVYLHSHSTSKGKGHEINMALSVLVPEAAPLIKHGTWYTATIFSRPS
jgi:hypothetical protein